MSEDVVVRRLTEVGEELADTVWRVCRHCNEEIPPSAPNMAYCDDVCKRESMAGEMGLGADG